METGTIESAQAEATPERRESRCDPERVAIIFNPASGSGDPETRHARIEAAAQAAGLTCGLIEADRERGAASLARKAVEDGIRRVLVCGGDGTVTEAASALVGSNVELAVLPGGTGNLLALNLGLSAEPDSAMRMALAGEARPFDVGRIGETVFLFMAGIGADARMVRDANRAMKQRHGVLAYFISAWRHLRRPPDLYTIAVDGQRFRRRAQSVLIANLGRITGGMELVPGADPDDGLLEVAILKAETIGDIAKIAIGGFLGRISGDELVEIHRGRHIIIRTRSAQPVQVDGNPVGSTRRLEVRVEPGALRLVRGPGPGAPPVVAALTGGEAALRLSMLAGLATSLGMLLGARIARSRGREPAFPLRHPFVSGCVAAVVARVAAARARGRSPRGGSS